jgi:uncharacterized protein (TIGR01244 family)
MRSAMARFLILSVTVSAAAFVSAGVESIEGFYRISDRVAIGTQPTPDEVTALAAEGFNGIVNLREDAEFDDGPSSQAARDSGIRFVRVPLSSKDPSDAGVEKFLAATDDDGLYPVFIYCASGNRAAAVWMVRRVLREGWTVAEARAEAERAGLKSTAMRDFALDFIRHADKKAGEP